MKRNKIKKYDIDNFDKLINVMNDENINNLCIDVSQWLICCNEAIKEIRKKYPKETDKKNNSEIIKCSFLWIDDKKTELKGIEIHNDYTGEVIEKKF